MLLEQVKSWPFQMRGVAREVQRRAQAGMGQSTPAGEKKGRGLKDSGALPWMALDLEQVSSWYATSDAEENLRSI